MFSVTNDDGKAITIEGRVPGDPGAVFDAFTTSQGVEGWWATEATTEPKPGGSFHLAWPGPGWHLRGEYLVFERPTALRFSWSWDHDEVDAEVQVNLQPGETGTRITIVHTYSNIDERDGYVEGWLHFLPRLVVAV